MTGKEVYRAALALLFETENTAGEDYDKNALPLLNVLLAETFGVNVGMREVRELAPLAETPELESLEDDIPYETALSRTALPYGLAAKLLIGDDESERGQDYLILFANAVNTVQQTAPRPVADVYG